MFFNVFGIGQIPEEVWSGPVAQIYGFLQWKLHFLVSKLDGHFCSNEKSLFSHWFFNVFGGGKKSAEVSRSRDPQGPSDGASEALRDLQMELSFWSQTACLAPGAPGSPRDLPETSRWSLTELLRKLQSSRFELLSTQHCAHTSRCAPHIHTHRNKHICAGYHVSKTM